MLQHVSTGICAIENPVVVVVVVLVLVLVLVLVTCLRLQWLHDRLHF